MGLLHHLLLLVHELGVKFVKRNTEMGVLFMSRLGGLSQEALSGCHGCAGQMGSFFVVQGASMDRVMFGGRFVIPSASLALFNTISIIVLIPIYDRGVVPLLHRFGMKLSHLQRIGEQPPGGTATLLPGVHDPRCGPHVSMQSLWLQSALLQAAVFLWHCEQEHALQEGRLPGSGSLDNLCTLGRS